MLPAVGVGAGVTDLYQDFNQNWGWAYQYQGGSGAVFRVLRSLSEGRAGPEVAG
jgi:hypothetical protein